MGRASRQAVKDALKTRHVLFSCEGTAEEVIVGTLADADALVVPSRSVVRDMHGNPYTSLRKARDVEREFLGIDYPDGLLIARIVDVNPGAFRLNRLYQEPFADIMVGDFITRPEIERLVLVREGELDRFQSRHGRDRQLNASDWCVQKLGMTEIKKRTFLQGYWSDANELVRCIRAAQAKLGGNKKDQLGIVDLLK